MTYRVTLKTSDDNDDAFRNVSNIPHLSALNPPAQCFPVLGSGPKMGHRPVFVEVGSQQNTLKPISLLNYSKLLAAVFASMIRVFYFFAIY